MTLFQPSFNEFEDILEIIQRDERQFQKSSKCEDSHYPITPSTSTLSSSESNTQFNSSSPVPPLNEPDIFSKFRHSDAFYDDQEQSEINYFHLSSMIFKDINAPKVCSICGEPTNCCHYDIPSCSGCKTFFRRSVLSSKEYICKCDGKCEIMKGDRCRSCRFSRCIITGMNPAAIKMPDNVDINAVIEHVNNHRKRLLPSLEENDSSESSESDTFLTVLNKMTPIFNQTHQSREIDFLLFLEMKVQKLRESNYNPRPLYFATIGKILESKTELRNCHRYIKPSTWPIWKDNLEKLYESLPPAQPGPPIRMWTAIDAIICIEMAKTLPFFDKLIASDKCALLKCVTLMNTVLTQCYYSYIQHGDAIILPDGLMPIRFARHKQSGNLKYEAFVRSLDPIKRINMTKEEYVLLKTLVFCYPAAKDVSDKGRKILEKEFERYSQLLLNHMQAKMGAAPGAVKYGQVIAIIEALAHFGEKFKELHLVFKIRDGAHKKPLQILEEIMD